MTKYVCILIAVLLIVFFAIGSTGFILKEKSYSSTVSFYDFSKAGYWGENVISSFERLAFIPRTLSKLLYKVVGSSVTLLEGDCYDFSGEAIDLSALSKSTMCRVIPFADGTYLVYVGTGRKSPSYVIFCDSPYLDFEKGRRIDTFTSDSLYGFLGIYRLRDIRVYDTSGSKYLVNGDGSVRTLGDYFPDSKLLDTYFIFKDITIAEAEEICGCVIVDHGGGGGKF